MRPIQLLLYQLRTPLLTSAGFNIYSFLAPAEVSSETENDRSHSLIHSAKCKLLFFLEISTSDFQNQKNALTIAPCIKS